MWRSLCIASMTWGWPATPESLEAGPFIAHPTGAKKYLQGLRTRPVPSYHPDAFVIVGADCYTFFGRFGAVLLQHWTQEEHLLEIRRASVVPGGTRVGLWANYESVAGPGPMGPPWDRVQTVLWNLCMQNLLVGTDGAPVNLYEPASPGVLLVDIRKPDLAQAYVSGLEWILSTYYRLHRPDFIFYDAHDPRRWYPQSVSNAPPFPEAEYRAGWDALDHYMARVGLEWAHNPGDVGYPRLGARIHEHALREHLGAANLAAWIGTSLLMNPAYLGVGSEAVALPPKPGPYFLDIRNRVGPHREDLVYLQTARSGKAFRIFETAATF